MAYFGVDVGNLSLDPFLDRKTESYIGRVEYEADFATITSITALKKLRISDGRDLEGSRSEEHTSELQSLMRISYAVFCLKKKNRNILDRHFTHKYKHHSSKK